MAILQKRKSTKQLPRFERYQDTRGGDRAAALRGETPITSAVRQLAGTSGYGPMGDQGFNPMSGRGPEGVLGTGAAGFGGRPAANNVTSTLAGTSAKPAGTSAATPKTITSTGTGATKPAAPSSKLPSLTSTTGATKPATALTSTGSGAAKTTGTTPAKTLTSAGSGTAKTSAPATTAKTSSSGSTLGKTLTSALAGAALGVGTKAVVDKFTGGNKTNNTSNTANSGTGLKVTGNKNLDTMGGGTGLTSTTNTGGTGIKTTGTSGTGLKTTGTTGTTGSTVVTSPVKTPVVKTTGTTGTTGTTKTTPTSVVRPTTTVGPKTPISTGPKTPTSTGPKTPTGTGPKTPAGTGGTRGIAGGTGAAVGAATTGDDTTDTTVTGVAYDDDGNLMPGYELDENGDPVFVGTDITDNTDTTLDTDTGDDTTVADGYFTDDEGNVYDGEGNLVQYADGSAYEGDGGTEVAYTDEYGNTYDANGDLIAEGDHSDYVYTADDGSTYDWDGNLIAEADHTGFTQEDEYGNTYDYDGNLISYAEGYNPDDYNTDDTTVASNDDEPIDEGKRGGLFSMAKGGVPRFASGDAVYSDTSEEVQPFQNVNYNYGEFDDPTMTGNNSLYSASGGYSPTYARSANTSASDPVAQNDNGDGTVTQFFDDGSSITYDTDGNVVDVTEATDVATQGGSSSQAGTGNRQFFDDGSSVETFDDGSQIRYNPDGSVYDSVEGYQTTYDDEGNAIVTDGFGNIVNVYDPQGNVIPLGGGRVTGPTSITSAGGGKQNYDLTPNKTPAQIAADKRAAAADDRAQQSAIDKLLAGINTNTGAGVTGAVLGALLGNSDLLGGGSGGNNAGIDMSKVGVINPRTTDFGIGPAKYVGYDEYGTPEAMPELYGNELYQNLNAPGFNEVNPGDYAAMDAGTYGDNENTEVAPDDEQVEGMAEGGLPQGGLGASQTFYTFGKATDPMQNLYNPQPAQQQQAPQGMPPQAAQNQQQMAMSQPVQALPTGMPQGAPQGQNMGMGKPPMQQQNPMQTGPQGLKSGGLPAWSNVPMTAGRLNFRDGAPVHGAGDGQSDDIPAMLADGEYVIDAETVAQIGNGSTKAGAQALDKFRENIRSHKRSAPINKIPPKTKALTSYLRGAK